MTRLKALELLGFKSFADRTRFEFPGGVTAVVGPNGSGKSNVVDAIKWVLGEQSVRSLRGREMTDVIFAGSASRKPLGAAEATLVFDNTARRLPVDADEVLVGRRVYRSGESEYLLNGEVCRLRDVRDLFSGTGAATEAYSVIEQGRVDALLVATGKDRRAVFEEAAGITRFRARRADALRRLERAEQNRQRLADIVGEVAARLETLRHQAARARRWRQMTDRLRALRIAAAREDLSLADADVESRRHAIEELQGHLATAEHATAAAAAEAEARRAEEAALDPEIERARAALAAGRSAAAAAVARLEPLRERAREQDGEIARVETEAALAAARRREARDHAGAAARASAAVAEEAAEIEARIAECERVAAGSHTSVEEVRDLLASLATRTGEIAERRQATLIEADRAAGRHDDCRRACDESRSRIDAARRRAAAAEEAIAARDGNLSALAGRLADTSSAIAAGERDARERNAAVERAWRELAAWEAKLEACRERRGVLEEIAARSSGAGEGARRLVADASPAAGVGGPLAESVDAPLEWAGIADVALATSAQDITVASLGPFLEWFEEWSAGEAGAAALASGGRIGIVADDADPPEDDVPALDGEAGIVGRLDRLVAAGGTPPSGAAARILAAAWVTETFADAHRLASAHPRSTFLSRDGRACRGARVEVGSLAPASGVVSRRAELKALAEREEELVRRVEARAAEAAAERSAADAAVEAVRALQSRRQHEAETLAEGRADAARLRRELDAAAEARSAAEAALADAERRAAEAQRRRDETAERLAALEAETAAIATRRREAETTLAGLDKSRGSVVEEMQKLRVRMAAAEERRARAADEAESRRREAAEREGRLEDILRRAEGLRRRQAEADLETLATGAALAEAAWAARVAEESLRDLVDRQAAARGAAASAARAAEAGRAALSTLAERIHAVELEAGEARHRRSRVIERIRDEYDIDLDAADDPAAAPPADAGEDPLPTVRADLDAAIEDLRRRLASMTTVNLEALSESEQLAERLAGLEAQLADVTGAKQAIEQLIARIDEESRQLLATTIETVRTHFRALFERVFGGGQADIVLEPGVDVLETSVEIVARPPGKEPRSISLLSGGEKTMTCVALLLAIFRSRPSPFCVLDEVDAALDDANVDRFVGVLREFPDTQIIVVTHRKATMAAADTLYGVTMEEGGVSKRVSVRFEHAAAAGHAAAPRAAA